MEHRDEFESPYYSLIEDSLKADDYVLQFTIFEIKDDELHIISDGSSIWERDGKPLNFLAEDAAREVVEEYYHKFVKY